MSLQHFLKMASRKSSVSDRVGDALGSVQIGG